MNLERIVGSVITSSGPQPFVLHTQTGQFEVGSFVGPDEGQRGLSVIQQQRLVQLIAERAGVSFAQVRLGQFFDDKDNRWVDVLHEPWKTETAPAIPAEAVEAASDPLVGETISLDEEGTASADIPELDEELFDVALIGDSETARLEAEEATERVVPAEDVLVHVEAEAQDAVAPAEEGMLENAIHIAVEAHRGQSDKAGAPYILHPLRLMLSMQTVSERIAAVLHDVVEDSGWTLDDLRREGFSDEILEAVDSLTRREGEPYEAFIERAGLHPVARRVKRADLEDNMEVRRLAVLTPRDQERLARYLKAWQALKE